MSSPGTTDPLPTPDPVGEEAGDRLIESGGEPSPPAAPAEVYTLSSQPSAEPNPGGSTDSLAGRSAAGTPDRPSVGFETGAGGPGGWRRLGRRAAAGVVLSLFTHAAILYGLSLWLTDPQLAPTWSPPLLLDPEWVPPRDELTHGVVIRQELGDPLSRAQPAETLPVGDPTRHVTPPEVAFPQKPFERTARWTIGPPREDFLPSHDWLAATGAAEGGGLEGRGADARHRLLLARGGTPAGEAAVQLGLEWLASAQLADGSWHFNHHAGPLRDKCSHAGSVGSTTGATALGLLPFLGAGVTPDSNHEHRDAVSRGLNYLLQRQQITAAGGDLQEGTMYSQGLATLALCEAYAMTGDRQIGEAAQRAVDFIGSAQHADGGWRYFPGQAGDMTVTGWQMMALRSGQLAQLRVPQETLVRATRFLNRMESERGAFYGYMEPGKSPSPTAIGLLMRMYNGWPQEDQRLAQGVAYLAELGPSRDDMYFNYYATQVLHHYERRSWDAWNETLREYLIETQSQAEFERGSWYFFDRHGAQGGRHYNTAMAIMILEVYYRYMPLYTNSSVDDGTESD